MIPSAATTTWNRHHDAHEKPPNKCRVNMMSIRGSAVVSILGLAALPAWIDWTLDSALRPSPWSNCNVYGRGIWVPCKISLIDRHATCPPIRLSSNVNGCGPSSLPFEVVRGPWEAGLPGRHRPVRVVRRRSARSTSSLAIRAKSPTRHRQELTPDLRSFMFARRPLRAQRPDVARAIGLVQDQWQVRRCVRDSLVERWQYSKWSITDHPGVLRLSSLQADDFYSAHNSSANGLPAPHRS